MIEDTPDEYVTVLFDEHFWEGDPLGRPIVGTRETVGNITRREILNYVSQSYSPSRVIIAGAGKVDHDLLVECFRPSFEPLPNGDSSPPVRSTPRVTPTVASYPKELEQVHLCVGAQASSLSGERRYAESIFNAILGGNMSSRLFQEIREKRGLAYSLYSHISAYMDTGLIRIYVATDKEQVNRVLELIEQQIKGIQRGDLSTDDVARAKEYLMGGILLAAESMGNLMIRLARNEFIFERYISYEELIAELKKVTLDEVIGVARGIFSTGKVSLTLLGPVDRDKVAVDPLNF
jgi:predicted Zn-dependent peptidase